MVENQEDEELKEEALKLTGELFLHAMTIAKYDPNFQLEADLWRILKCLPFQQRFQHYSDLLCKGYLSNISMLTKFIELHPKVIKWSKAISSNEKETEQRRGEA